MSGVCRAVTNRRKALRENSPVCSLPIDSPRDRDSSHTVRAAPVAPAASSLNQGRIIGNRRVQVVDRLKPASGSGSGSARRGRRGRVGRKWRSGACCDHVGWKRRLSSASLALPCMQLQHFEWRIEHRQGLRQVGLEAEGETCARPPRASPAGMNRKCDFCARQRRWLIIRRYIPSWKCPIWTPIPGGCNRTVPARLDGFYVIQGRE